MRPSPYLTLDGEQHGEKAADHSRQEIHKVVAEEGDAATPLRLHAAHVHGALGHGVASWAPATRLQRCADQRIERRARETTDGDGNPNRARKTEEDHDPSNERCA